MFPKKALLKPICCCPFYSKNGTLTNNYQPCYAIFLSKLALLAAPITLKQNNLVLPAGSMSLKQTTILRITVVELLFYFSFLECKIHLI